MFPFVGVGTFEERRVFKSGAGAGVDNGEIGGGDNWGRQGDEGWKVGWQIGGRDRAVELKALAPGCEAGVVTVRRGRHGRGRLRG